MLPLSARLNRLFRGMGFILLLSWSIAPASTEAAGFARVWQTDDGLLNNNIHAIVQTPDDYLWVATPVSLMRFDGVNFSSFPVKDFTGQMEPHNIRTLLCSRSGVLWMLPNLGAMAGLKPDFSVATLPPNGPPPNAPQTAAEDKDGSLWLGYASAIYHIKGGQVTSFSVTNGVPQDGTALLTCDGAGNIWLAKGNHICFFQDGKFQPVAVAKGIQCLAATHTNAILLVAGTHLVTCGINGTLLDLGAFENSPATLADALLEDHTGAVWVGTDGNGLFRYNGSSFEQVETSHSAILSLAEDREGNVWVGTGGGGLDRLSPGSVRQEVFKYNQTLEQIQSICEDSNGKLWGATHNGALVSREAGRWNPVFTNAPFAGIAMCVAGDSNGIVWIGTRSGKLFRLTGTNYTDLDPKSGPIYALKPTKAGDLWISGRRLQRWHDGTFQTISPPRPIPRISAIAEDSNGNVWVGSKGAVMRFDGKTFIDETSHLSISNRAISCLYADPDGRMWISCGGLGLIGYKDGRVGQIGVEQGLYNTYISQMVADNDGWFWFGSDRGIFKIRQRELERAMDDHNVRLRPIVYGRNEGLPSLEAVFSTALPYVQPRAILTQDGQVWLLTHTGVVVADPKVLPENVSPPRVLLTQMAVDGQIIASYGNIAPAQTVASIESPGVPLRLPPGHRHLQFDFAAIHLSAPENVRFRYQLVNFDNDWIDAGTRRSADYSRLPAGDYKFRVQACIGDGQWTESPASLSLSVSPFLWQTWWFRIAVVALFTASVIAIVRYISFRRLQMQMRLLEQRAALDKERTRIARDLHDDLGGSLNSVALTLDMMQRAPAPPDAINGKIRHCSTMIRQVAKSVDEIVWAINPRNDTLRYVVDYISQFAVEFMHAADITCRVDLPDNIPDAQLSPEARHNLFLVVKEALNNIVRHARATEVRLYIATTQNHVNIIIEDNGQGFKGVPDNASSDGLRNMRNRIEEIGGQFQLVTSPGAGARVTFLYSWPSSNGTNGNPNMPYSFNGHRST